MAEAEVARLGALRDGADDGHRALRRPGARYADVVARFGVPPADLSPAEVRRVEIQVGYDAYIERSRKHLEARAGYERTSLDGVAFDAIPSLSNEGRETLERGRPATLGAAQRLQGVRDSDVTALLVHLKRAGRVSRETSPRG